jgi:hypothetical protein
MNFFNASILVVYGQSKNRISHRVRVFIYISSDANVKVTVFFSIIFSGLPVGKRVSFLNAAFTLRTRIMTGHWRQNPLLKFPASTLYGTFKLFYVEVKEIKLAASTTHNFFSVTKFKLSDYLHL